MKTFFRTLCAPVLNYFEEGEGDFVYKPSHRTILMAVGLLFLLLAAIAVYVSLQTDRLAGLLPATVFSAVGLVCEIVALLGSDRAVAKIWHRR